MRKITKILMCLVGMSLLFVSTQQLPASQHSGDDGEIADRGHGGGWHGDGGGGHWHDDGHWHDGGHWHDDHWHGYGGWGGGVYIGEPVIYGAPTTYVAPVTQNVIIQTQDNTPNYTEID